jgi:hypothetical protein
MTLIDFIELKNAMPYKKYRNDTKQVNFGCIFGAIFTTLAASLDGNGYTEQDCDEFIKELGLEDEIDKIAEKYPLVDYRTRKFYVVAKFSREQFFKTYPGLEERITREIQFAIQNGYVRSWHGPVRHLSWLMFVNFKDRWPQGADKSFSKMISEAFNICANTAIQTFESFIIFNAEKLFKANRKKWEEVSGYIFKSFPCNTVHDSVDAVVYDWEEDPDGSELELMASLMTYCFECYREPNFGIPFPSEVEVADLAKGHSYKSGEKYKPVELPIAIKNFCERNNLSLFPILPPDEIGSKGKYEIRKRIATVG